MSLKFSINEKCDMTKLNKKRQNLKNKKKLLHWCENNGII